MDGQAGSYPHFQFLLQKGVRYGQLPDLGAKFLHLLLIDLGLLPAASSPFRSSSAPFALNSGACCFRFDISDLLLVEDSRLQIVAYGSVRISEASSRFTVVVEA